MVTEHVARTALPCTVHRVHAPSSHVNEIHHVWPTGDDGPNIPANKVVICATGHNSTHQLLDAYRHAGGDPGLGGASPLPPWRARVGPRRLGPHPTEGDVTS